MERLSPGLTMEINTPILQAYTRAGIGWFRILGRGLHWKDTRRHPLLFSERHGFRKRRQFGPWSFSFLARNRP